MRRAIIERQGNDLTLTWPLSTRLRYYIPHLTFTVLWYPAAFGLLGMWPTPPDWLPTFVLVAPLLGMVLWVPRVAAEFGRAQVTLRREADTLHIGAIETRTSRCRVSLDPIERRILPGHTYRVVLRIEGLPSGMLIGDFGDRDRANAAATEVARFLRIEVDEAAILL